MCDLDELSYYPTRCPTAKNVSKTAKKLQEKSIAIKKNKTFPIRKKPVSKKITKKSQAKSIQGSKPLTSEDNFQELLQKESLNNNLKVRDEWIAINEEGMQWYVGRIKTTEVAGEKKIFDVDNIMFQAAYKKAKYFKFHFYVNTNVKIISNLNWH